MTAEEKKWNEEKNRVLLLGEWFDENREKIICGHHGEQVLISGNKVVGYYPDEESADAAVSQYGFLEGDYILQDCITKEEEMAMYTFMGGVNFA